LIIPGDSLSTQDEARRVRDYLRGRKDINSIIMVTSKYHSGRAKRIFLRAMSYMDREIRVISCPSKYDDFNPDNWWRDRENSKQVVQEYAKMADYYLWEQFHLSY